MNATTLGFTSLGSAATSVVMKLTSGGLALEREVGMDEDLVFIDVEASGLHADSYPIEIGWSFLDLRGDGFLVRPAADWTEELWDPRSELVHGITREQCMREGLDVWDAARRLNFALAGRTFISDAPEFDRVWLQILFEATGVEPEVDLALFDAMGPIKEALMDRGLDFEAVERQMKARWPRSHRATADAVHLAAMWRAAREPGFLENS